MPISAPQPVVIPATEEKQLNSLWFRQFVMQLPAPSLPAQMTCEFGPWSGVPSEDPVWRDRDGRDLAQQLVIQDIWEMREAVPAFDQAYKAFILAIPEVMNYLASQAAAAKAAAEAEAAAKAAAEAEAAAKAAAEAEAAAEAAAAEAAAEQP